MLSPQIMLYKEILFLSNPDDGRQKPTADLTSMTAAYLPMVCRLPLHIVQVSLSVFWGICGDAALGLE